MKEPYGEGLASHTDPESCTASRPSLVFSLFDFLAFAFLLMDAASERQAMRCISLCLLNSGTVS